MNDCLNAEIRDQLPELLHDRLSAGARAEVLAHVEQCAECRDELELLRGVHRVMLARTPRIDTARIVASLPKPGAAAVVPMRPSRSRWADWRIAATITVIAGGATSAALLMHSRPGAARVDTVAVSAAPSTPAPASPTPETTTTRSVAPATNVGVTSASAASKAPDVAVADVDQPSDSMVGADIEANRQLRNLSDRQLRALLTEIEQFKAVPITEPEPVAINVNARSSSELR
ncbi:MAG: zf-HC2 domain-containing protein [Gemmatimonadaceae bacterium]